MTPDPSLAALIARRLASLRRQHGLSQAALGAVVGASQATVSRWEQEASGTTLSALEAATLARHFRVSTDWLLGLSPHQEPLPAGEAIMDRALLQAFIRSTEAAELEELLERELSFGTIWVQIPAGAEVMTLQEAHRLVKEADRHVRRLHPGLWQRWAKLVIG